MTTVGLLLAAGRSERFGTHDKLLAPLRGRPLVAYPAEAMRALGLDHLVAVISDDAVAAELDGFRCIAPEAPAEGQSDSLRAGVQSAMELGADKVLIVLGDMPRVTPELLREVVARCSANSPSATTDGSVRQPPACFPRAWFPQLLQLSGDRGAGSLLADLPEASLVRAALEILSDVDRPADLDGLR